MSIRNIIIILVLAIIALTSILYFGLFSASVSEPILEPVFLSIGDKLGGFTVTSVNPFNPERPLASNNAKILLRGPVEITGTFGPVNSAIGFSGYCMKEPDLNSISNLPSLSIDPKPRIFCFRNEEVVQKQLGDVDLVRTIVIDNYELNSYPAEVVDWVDLVSFDEHFFINNTLKDVNLCGKIYRTKQLIIDGIDVVQRIADITDEMNRGIEKQLVLGLCGNITSEPNSQSTELEIYGPATRDNGSTTYYMGIGKFIIFTIDLSNLQIEVAKAEEGSSVAIGKLK